MIRYSVLSLFVTGLIVYAWKDWCKALCALVVMLAVLERPDMPKTMFGIQGLNPLNIALFGILLAWAAHRSREGYKWDAPAWFNVLFSLYVLIVFTAFVRLYFDPPPSQSGGELISEFLVNTFKWTIPGILLLDGCRTQERYRWAVICVLGMYVLLAYQVIRQIPPQYLLDGEALQARAASVLQRRVGYHRVDLATVFAGASWAMLAARPLFASRITRTALLGLAGFVALGLASTGGRTGYATWCLVGLTLSFLRWRRYLLLAPIGIVLVLPFAPGVTGRMMQGFDVEEQAQPVHSRYEDLDVNLDDGTDEYLVTSGRSVTWPYIIDKIKEQPIFGSGRLAIVRTGLQREIYEATGELFGHPHNAYFEFALDNGLIGMAIVLPFYGMVLLNSLRMFRNERDPVTSAVGGMALAMSLAFLIGAFGSHSFYPKESATGLWCLMCLSLRVARDREKMHPHGTAADPERAPASVSVARESVALWPQDSGPAAARTTGWPARRASASEGYAVGGRRSRSWADDAT